MKTAITALVAFVALGSLASSSIGCSSSSSEKEEVDTGSALTQLRTPTGSFSDKTAGAAFGNYRSTRADSSKVSAPGGVTGDGTSTQSIRLLDKAALSACRQGDSCACPGGGALTYTAGTTADGALVKVRFDACKFEDGFGFDGKAILLVSKKSLLGIADAPAAPSVPSKSDTSDGSDGSDNGGLQEAPNVGASTGYAAASVLLAAKGTASYGSRTLALEFALIAEAHYAFLAVKVPDGSIVIGVNDRGDAIVRSKEGTWKCHTGTSGWKCTSDKGQSMEVVEQASSEGSVAPSGPSAPSSPPSTDTGTDLDG